MSTYLIPESLTGAYHGAGWALAAITDGQVVALRYIQDVSDVTLADQLDGDHAAFFVRQWLETTQSRSVMREMQALGHISIGMCSNRKFVEL